MIRRLSRKKGRWGVEAVEAAITLPLLTLVMFSTIQITHRWHVEKMLKLAAFEAIKAGASKDGDADTAVQVFNDHAQALGINDARLVIDHSRFDNAQTGDYLWVRGVALSKTNRFSAPINIQLSSWMSGGWVFHRKEGL